MWDTQLIKNTFKCCGISVATNGSEDDLIFNYDHAENNNKINNNNEVNEYIFNNKNLPPTPTRSSKKLLTQTKLPKPSIPTMPLIPRTLSSARFLVPTKPSTSTRFFIKSTLFTPTKSFASAKLLILTTTR
ncbi:25569_t:CDS:2 [Dentiscutata erythropus]|uniref:25569_t:CDS:1 n=1 Tax=Dentiscutata erythropus TaxID=1348616 RepID=A0A9N8W053_9GLOM|nr:25569_t:CDS:2 [Dentiscutata erythropus]